MTIFVGSSNPVKINAVIIAASETWPDVAVRGFEVKSGISEQPMTDEETRQGAENRARAALDQGEQHVSLFDASETHLGMGLEGGVFRFGDELWSTVWVAVVDDTGAVYTANGARFRVPDVIAKPILAGGEMGPVVSKLFGIPDIKKKNGAIGVITNNFVDRAEEYSAIAKMALGLWYGKDWVQQLSVDSTT